MTEQEFALVSDVSLSTDARIVALYLAQQGDGFHELSRDDVQDLLSAEAGRDRAQRAVRQLERHGVIERRAGGKGHADRFAVKGPAETVPKGDSNRQKRYVNAPVAVVADGDVTDTPFNSPAGLDERTEHAIEQHSELLAGCRGALRDYLQDYVTEPRKRHAFVQLIAGWLNNIDPNIWRLPDGSRLPPDERPPALALALNDLGASTRKMKSPPGDPANLRTKLNVHLRQRADHERGDNGKSHRGGPATPRRGTAPPAGDRPERRNPFGADLDGEVG